MTPRIAIPLPTSFDNAYNWLNFPAYADCIRASGGDPIELRLDLPLSEVGRVAETCDGILLPGSPADVDPRKYGQAVEEATARPDHQREAVDNLLLSEVMRRRIPILAVCFGAQMLNVHWGGTLIQDLTILPVNHSAGRSVAIAHTVTIAPGSLLSSIVDLSEVAKTGGELRLPVNSSHHQAVGIAGQTLHVSARCAQDFVVEAIEMHPQGEDDAPFVLGVQWHPERTFHE